MSLVLHLHMHLAHVVGAFGNVLNGEFLYHHLTPDDELECIYGGIHRTVALRRRFEFLS